MGKKEITKVVVFDKEVRNIHNNGPMQNLFKLTAYGIVAIFFVVLPFLPVAYKERYPFLNLLSPSKYMIAPAVCMLILNQIALYLYRQYNTPTSALTANVSEFEEIMIYYILLLYFRELLKKPQHILFAKNNPSPGKD
jgi:hypothetical protein